MVVISIHSILLGCTFLKADSCADQANLPQSEVIQRGCDGGFLSAEAQRETTYQGDDSARLWTGAEYRRPPNIDANKINQAPFVRAPITAWSGSLRTDIADDENAIRQDIANIRLAGAGNFDPDEKVTVKFEKASLDFFLKQMLSGALGVSYVAPDDLTGSITFRTEQPIYKSQVLQVVRDVLARNGLEMRYMSGVYQIGTPEAIAAIEQTAAAGRRTDQVTRVVRLQKGNIEEVINFVRQLTPDGVNLVASSGRDSIIVKAPPDEVDRVVELIGMADGTVGDDRVAIIPLRQSAPEKVARQLDEFYRARNESITVIPLENQQALLVGTRDRRTLRAVKELVGRLDRDTGGDSTLRIIPLVHLGAEEVVPLLTAIFAEGGVGGGVTSGPTSGSYAANQGGAASTSRTSTIISSSPAQQDGTNNSGASNGSNGSSRPRSFLEAIANSNNTDSVNGSSGNTNGSGATSAAPAANGVVASSAPGVKFVADTRNNAVMVHSSYSVYKLIKERLKILDVPQSQVVIEAMVAEVVLNDELSHGVEAFLTASGINVSSSGSGTKPPLGTGNSGGLFLHAQFSSAGAQADVILRALQSVTNVKIISTPYLTVVDGKKARLVIGDQVPFETATVTSQAGGANIITRQITVRDTGVVLEITPKIRPNNAVLLDINQSVSNVAQTSVADSLTPTISTRMVESDVIIQSGSTVMLGGLVEDRNNRTETGVPIARNIPIVGDLFKQREDNGVRRELIILITPRVIRHSIQLETITRQMRGLMHIRR